MEAKGQGCGDRGGDEIARVLDLIELAGRLPSSTVLVAGGHRVEDLRLVESARDHGIVERIVLVGAERPLREAVAEVGIDLSPQDMIPAQGDEEIARATVELVRAGGIDIVLKGGISTPILNRHMLALAHRPTVSLVTIFDAACIAGGRPLILTDPGVTTVCNFGRLIDLIRNALEVAQLVLGIQRPRVAVLSANEKQVPSLPSTWMGLELARRSWPDALVCGPLSFDLATDPESVSIKGLPDLPHAGDVAGQADVLVCPGIDTANVLYKFLSALNKYGEASLANVTVGFPVPYIILSRSDSVEVRLASLALSAVYAQRTRQRPATSIRARDREGEGPGYRILVVNPGSTSLKVALFEDESCLREEEMVHEILLGGTSNQRQAEVAELLRLVREMLRRWGEERIDAISARGGFLPRPKGKLSGGVYLVAEKREGKVVVDEALVSAVRDFPEREHASNYGAPVAAALAQEIGAPAFIVDPVVVDEFAPEAEISGYEPIVRRSVSHALSIRAVARKAAREIGRPLEDLHLVVAHLGGGITVAALRGGKMVDNNIALLGGGPFTPQRAGDLPLGDLIDLCYSGRFDRDQLIQELTKRGGLRSYLGTDRMEEIERRIAEGDSQAELVARAMVYQIAKEIGKALVAAGGDVEAIVLTGGLVRSEWIQNSLRRLVGRLAPVMVYADNLEMAALAAGAREVLSGQRTAFRYASPLPTPAGGAP
jgi:butyrate kinase